jgi:hypothetical protein
MSRDLFQGCMPATNISKNTVTAEQMSKLAGSGMSKKVLSEYKTVSVREFVCPTALIGCLRLGPQFARH